MPEISILKPVIRVFGSDLPALSKVSVIIRYILCTHVDLNSGTPATWAQRRFFGGMISEGSWFSRLQSAAMKARPSPGTGKAIWGSIGLGLGIIGGLGACRR